MAYKLILNRGDEERVEEFGDLSAAFDAAMPSIMEGYVAWVADENGVVKYTQSLSGGQVATYPGDATVAAPAGEWGRSPAPEARRPWWRFW